MKSRTRLRTPSSIASIQVSKSELSAARAVPFVLSLSMAWSPARRANAGIMWVSKPGDYANPFPPHPGRHHDRRLPCSIEDRLIGPIGAQPDREIPGRSLSGLCQRGSFIDCTDGLLKRRRRNAEDARVRLTEVEDE